MLVHAPDTELGLAVGQIPRLRDLIRADVDPERVGAHGGRPAGDVTEAAAELHEPIAGALHDEGAVADSPEAIDAPIAVLSPLDAKGLEFDHVVVVEPADLVPADRAGLRLLYVVLTRATRALTIVHSEPLPEALTRA